MRGFKTYILISYICAVVFVMASVCVPTSHCQTTPIVIQWFHSPGCRACTEVRLLLDKIEQKYPTQISIERLDIVEPENYRRMMALERQFDIRQSYPMSVFIADQYLLGHEHILANLEETVARNVGRALAAPPSYVGRALAAPPSDTSAIFARLRPAAVASAGLIDGVNPCAFASMVFLVSLLLGRRFSRPQILLAGLAFSAAVFIAYFLIGLGVFRAVYRMHAFPILSSMLFWTVAVLVIGLGVLSLKDAVSYYKTGRSADIILAMPQKMRIRLHTVLRAQIRPLHVGIACFVAGMLVSVMELVCTGQIYFPTIMMLASNLETRWSVLPYLLLYNFMFILPLLVVMGLCLGGVQLGSFVNFSRKSVVAVKFALAVVFFGLGAALILPRISSAAVLAK